MGAKMKNWRMLVLGFLAVGLVGWLDYVTGYEASFGIFYLLPVALITWTNGPRWGTLTSVLCACVWLFVDLAVAHPYSNIAIPFWNAGARLGFFLVVALLISQRKKATETVREARNQLEIRVQGRTAELQKATELLSADVEERKRQEKEIRRLNRLYVILSQVNQAIVRSSSREELLQRICDVAVQYGGFKIAWIGWLDESTGKLKPVARAGKAATVINRIQIIVDESAEHWGLAGTAIRESHAVIINDFQNDPRTSPIRDAAREHGLASGAGLPIRVSGRICGALSLLSAENGFFQPDEISLLNEVAKDISFALERYEKEQQLRRTEEALRESEERLRCVVSAAQDAIIMLNPDGKISFWNESAVRIFGYSAKEAMDQDLHELLAPSRYFDDFKKGLSEFRDSGKGAAVGRILELIALRKSGEEFPIELSLASVQLNKKWHAIGIVRDISERKQAEKAQALLAAGIEEVSEVIALADKNMSIQYINAPLERMTGYTQKRALGLPVLNVFPTEDMSFASAVQNAFKHGESWKGQFEAKKADGSEYRVEAAVTPVRDKEGSILSCLLVIRDIAQEEKLKERLIRSEKMEALGTLAGGIAHDFNNILSSIIGYAELTTDDIPKGTLAFDNLAQVLQAGQRGKDLVKQILSFSRQEKLERAPVQVKGIVEETVKLLRASIPSNIEMRLNLQSVAIVMADSTQISQVLMNLCTNAVSAMSDRGGILEVSLKDMELDADFVSRYPSLQPGSYLRLSVSDTGHGIAPSILGRIFEPFFTTKEKSMGTGMGLPVVHGIVQSLGGEITVYSKPGKGTTFNVFFPKTKAVLTAGFEGARPLIRGEESILFVDDEAQIVDIGKQILERLGYRVFTRTSSIEALEAFRAQPDKFDLVITDMTMPNMTGDRLAAALRRIRPDIPIILCTGFSERITEENAKYAGIQEFLAKPLLRQDMAEAVRRVLDRAKIKE
jgi:PAS domain S-box-containing protein